MRHKILNLFCVALFISASIALADNQNVELVGIEPFGEASDVYTVGNYSYLCAGGTLVVLDVTTPSNPNEVGRVDTPGTAEAIHVAGNYAYIANNWAGLRVIDISNPANPQEAAYYDTAASAMDIFIVGNYAYIAAREAGLLIIDISDPENPQNKGIFGSPCEAIDLHVVGNYAYVADNEAEVLWVVNVSDPANPEMEGYCRLPEEPEWVYVAGDYAYICSRWEEELVLVDISDPENPEVALQYSLDGYDDPHCVQVVGDYAYIATRSRYLLVMDISDPLNPEIEGEGDDFWYVSRGLHVVGDYAYIATEFNGLNVIDISDLTDPDQVGNYEAAGSCHAVHVAGDYAYLLDNRLGFRVIDASDPADPQDLSSLGTAAWRGDVFVVGNYAYVADGNGLQVIDISDPENPDKKGDYATAEGANDVYVVGNYAYVTAEEEGLLVIDISDPENPQKEGDCDTPWGANGVYVVGDYAYVSDDGEEWWETDQWGGLRIIDISDPTDPQQVWFLEIRRGADAVYVAGNYAYLAAEELLILDVSDPEAPQQAGAYYMEDARDVHVVGNHAYLVDSDLDRLHVIDISDPDFPHQVGFYDFPGEVDAIYAANGYVYTANVTAGMSIYRYTGFAGEADIVITASNERGDPDEYWYDFGGIEVGSHKDWDMVIYNVGGENLTIDSVVSDDPEFIVMSPPTFPQDIASGGELDVTIRFLPDEPDNYWERLTITSSDPDEPEIIVELDGQAAVADGHEADNDSANATQQIPNVDPQPEHSIFPADDEDWIYFNLIATSYVVAEMHDRGGDPTMWLYNSSLVELDFFDEDDDENNNDEDIAQVLPPGTYFLKVVGEDADEVCYRYWVELTAMPISVDIHEPDNDSAHANIQQPNMSSPPSHSIFPVLDEDWFEFTILVTNHVAINMELDGLYESPLATLYDSSLVEIDSGRHIFKVLDADTYYIKVQSHQAADVPVVPEYYVDITAGTPDDTFLIAVTEDEDDEIGEVLEDIDYEFVEITEQDLADYDFISFFDVIFINSSDDSGDNAPTAEESLERFVAEGGTLYTSSWGYVFIETSFPGNITFASEEPQGGDQDVMANIVDAGLADYFGESVWEIEYENEWMEIQAIDTEATVHISGPVNSAPECSEFEIINDMPLCVSFEHGDGKVIYTTFFHEDQRSREIVRILEYLALKPFERMLADLDDALSAQGYALEEEIEQGTIDQGGTSEPFGFDNDAVRDIAFGTNWPGSTLKLSVYRPNGSLYGEQQSDQPPVIIEIPDAEIGEWNYTITGVDVPNNSYAYVAQVSSAGGYTIALDEGWNLISTPMELVDTELKVALRSIEGNYDSIWAYNAAETEWEKYIVAGPDFLNNLEEFGPNKGFWIDMVVADELVLDTTGQADDPIDLVSGWNLVGYNCLTEMERDEALASIMTFLDAAWEYEAGDWDKYIKNGPPFLNDLITLKPNLGYWLDVTANYSWTPNCHIAAPPIAFANQSNHVSSPRPSVPYVIWGNIAANGVDITNTEFGSATVILKVDDAVRSHYPLEKLGGRFYALNVPTNVDASAKTELYIRIAGREIKASTIPIGKPGDITRLDLSVQISPRSSCLYQNYPNPFNPETWIPYQLGEDTNVSIKIYSATGRLVRTLNLGYQPAGFYTNREKSAYWDGRNEVGEQVASGVYFYSIKAGSYGVIKKMVVAR